eukprot:TRINITY_DN3917_c0_g1_i2.p1 TRINITY_DN3917_c0_g1~~TRINITY_DN3917_c0_g1_i2.p1  ORF type:complete len:165 (-),score=28.31 TRINITY_DN3917_c0_g1_i2:260-694(-)
MPISKRPERTKKLPLTVTSSTSKARTKNDCGRAAQSKERAKKNEETPLTVAVSDEELKKIEWQFYRSGDWHVFDAAGKKKLEVGLLAGVILEETTHATKPKNMRRYRRQYDEETRTTFGANPECVTKCTFVLAKANFIKPVAAV